MATLSDALMRIPPHNLEAERAILGAVLLDPSGLATATALLQPTDFYKEGHRQIYAAMLEAAAQGLDLITLSDHLHRGAALEEVGGRAYLAQLLEEGTTLTQLGSYCRIVAEKGRARELIRLASDLVGRVYDNGRPSTELLSGTIAALEQLAHRAAGPSLEAFPAISLAELVRLNIPDPTFHVEGWLPSKALSFIVGDSEAYKSWFALLLGMAVSTGSQFLEKFATVQANTLIISEENGLAEDRRRAACLARGHGIDLDAAPCWILSESGFSFDDAVRYAAMRRFIEEHRIELVLIDSFVRVHRRQEKDAGEMNALYLDRVRPVIRSGVSVVLLHHRRKHQPGPQPAGEGDEIRGSGDIRAAAHSVLFLRTLSDTQVLVKHNKTRGWRRQEPFVFSAQDPDPGATALVWEGKPQDALDKTGACREAILLFAAKRGSFPTKDLQAELKGRFSRKVYGPILTALCEKNTPLRKETRGPRHAAWYVYVPQDGAEEPSGVDGDGEELPF